MNETIADNPSHERVDSVLRAFFRKEMPNPWPQLDISPASAPASFHAPSWLARLGRPILVAAMALILMGYLTLAGKFPVSSEPGLKLDRGRTIGSKTHVEQPRLRKPQ